MRPIYFNGKFYAGGLNGVHRVADRLIREYDGLLAAMHPASRPLATLFVPRFRKWQPELKAIELVEEEAAHGQLWEQTRLPRLSADGVLVNLCNLAPLRHPRQLMLIHDAQFLFPDNGYPFRQRLGYRLLVPRMARASASVLTVSDYSRQMLDLLGVITRDHTRVLYNGADHILEQDADETIINSLGLTPSGYVMLFGSAKAYKNIAVVCEAMARSSEKTLVIVGSSLGALQAAGIALPERCTFTGNICDAQLRALYESAHCLAFPSRTEGFGLPPVEAMMCHCPVVASPAGAIPEICRDAIIYADVDDVDGWQQAISQLGQAQLRQAKSTQGYQRAQQFSWKIACETLHSAILSVEAL